MVFNRPEVTARVFEAVRRARPAVLLIIGDGARPSRPGEAERVAEVRAIVSRVDWPCDVRTNFAESNLGCKARLSSGITWAFSEVPECIVLEDDCLPDDSFFQFCDEMLERFRGDRRVFAVNGTNFNSPADTADSYYFSRQVHVWGWASWSDRWLPHYDPTIAKWPGIRDSAMTEDLVGGSAEARYWTAVLDAVHRNEIDTWDYQWSFACMLQAGAAVTPNVNLVSNIGFGRDATHTVRESHALANLPTAMMQFPLTHPAGMFVSQRMDHRQFMTHVYTGFRRRASRRVQRMLGFRG
jgi:hypothetical protein